MTTPTAALIIMQTTDNDGVPINQVDVGKLKEDYALTVLRMNTQVTALEATVVLPMNKEQHEELSKRGQELSNTLFTKFRDLCASLREALPGDAERLQEEHTEVLNTKATAVDKLMVDLSAKKPANGPGNARQQVPRGAGGGDVQPQEQRGVQGARQTVKLKPLDPPVFDGKAKSYSRFKQRFEEMINANFDDMGQLEFLE